ncbi:MAG: gliding motility protein GldC [Bacteroidota bacterium]|nr:gliding motility protein GldC [Bacteroidota bacterium]MDX5429107.1 gliding motility protein GldC [Bacteroidota bacterium]MDX5506756.1 gliding motility protein GldC [Bacteroidota bacterium]
MKRSDITVSVELDDNRVPDTITWSATDGGVDNKDTKAVMLSVWDADRQELLKIDLWTKDMMMDDMKKFIHQNLLSLANVLDRSTSEEGLSNDLRQFAQYYAEKLELLPKK